MRRRIMRRFGRDDRTYQREIQMLCLSGQRTVGLSYFLWASNLLELWKQLSLCTLCRAKIEHVQQLFLPAIDCQGVVCH
ncbi:hypothetical protein DPMN_175355 [Dreissena polymorpha]|uniref:Uncharacterized protein n=1 Tax=Dreissena polymorpha TaxID=45954 RepID=A0A9D4E8W7_DREPO|nr:hypothetical protein DPMN_175355 [Dreissena polymorpha]